MTDNADKNILKAQKKLADKAASADPTSPENLPLHDEGYNKSLSERHMNMMAIGGAIGTGLFMGAGVRLNQVGPSLIVVYALCGLCAFMILRAVGQLVMYRPSSGSFVTYAREFLGEGAAYTAGWFFCLNWALTGIADISAVALFVHYWASFQFIPQWTIALAALCIVMASNLVGVRYFGEMEFWLSLIKVASIIVFLVVGISVLAFGIHLHTNIAGHVETITPGVHMVAQHGGFFPHGFLPAILLIQGVIFAYAATELIGVTAGECAEPRKIVPKAVNSIIWRITIFYVGSIALLALVLPWSAYKAGESPFVTFFSSIGVGGTATIMNLVVITAALSSLNSGLYSTGRVLRALSLSGSAPKILSRLSKQKVPYVGILATVGVYIIGVGLNFFIPSQVFELALGVASIGFLGVWATILLCQLRLFKEIKEGRIAPTGFPMPFAPYSGWIALAFLASILVMMAFDYPSGTFSVAALPIFAVLLFIGWQFVRKNKQKNMQNPEQ
ncbi:amino acid permease [Acetobacteraceae bacterium]|nr:amino acid permease [Acetobacteraceae bacterium]